jgi:hypothetical protein
VELSLHFDLLDKQLAACKIDSTAAATRFLVDMYYNEVFMLK